MLKKGLCVRCKGKLLCGLDYCPILKKYEGQMKTTKYNSTDFSGVSPPGLFVSWQSYPKVTVSALGAPLNTNNASRMDTPEQWYGLPEQKIVEFRSSLLMGGQRFKAMDAGNPNHSLADIQELTMSVSEIDVDFLLSKKPEVKLSFSEFAGPLGPKAIASKIDLKSNPKIPRKVDNVTSDTDLKAMDGLSVLFNKGYPVSFLHKILSAGLLGIGKKRKLVPTRWAITAVDSGLGKQIIEGQVKGNELIHCFKLFNSNYLDNNFWILLAPRTWSFEQLECWLPGSTWTPEEKEVQIIQDHEFYSGRKGYASNVEGAYYAARLAVAEYLSGVKKQAACIVFREIGEKYALPLGVWQIRENVRRALQEKAIEFNSLNESLNFLSKQLRVPIEQYALESKILDWLKHQKTLHNF